MRRLAGAAALLLAVLWPVPAAGAAGTPASGAPSAIAAPIQSVRTSLGTVGYRALGRGRPLVLVMGYSGTLDQWEPAFLDALARNHRVLALDNEGIGRSTLSPGKLTISGMADHTAAFISAMHLRRPDVLGWSMGGFIGQALAVRHPDALRRLILCSTAPGNGRAAQPSAAVIQGLINVSTGNTAALVGLLFPPDQSQRGPAYLRAILRYPAFYLAPPATIAAQLAANIGWLGGHQPAGHQEGRIAAPTLVGAGADDTILPPANARAIAALIPHAQLSVYPDAAHAFLFQDEGAWVSRIQTFLRGRAR